MNNNGTDNRISDLNAFINFINRLFETLSNKQYIRVL